jgi:diguanylate cyclase (GGDEF)-like protein
MRRVLSLMQHAYNHGHFQGEVRVPRGGPFKQQWLHVAMTKAGRNLAVAVRDTSEVKAYVEELERRSFEDALTGLPNRRWLQHHLPDAIHEAESNNAMVALLFVDLDGFKAVNDSLGHSAGDALLRLAARRLKVAVRPKDSVTRFGGDEFVIVLRCVRHKDDISHVSGRIIQAFQEPFNLAQGNRQLGVSVGISMYPIDAQDSQSLIQLADVAMYSVKLTGRGDFGFFDAEFHERLLQRVDLELELRRAVELDQFVMYYQPRMNGSTGDLASMEALIRWQHPSKGLLGPAGFVEIAENSGLIVAIGEIVIAKVCQQIAEWTSNGWKPVSGSCPPD